MGLVDHARRELELCGQREEDPGYTASLVATVAAFASYGHSGGSAEMARHQLAVLLSYGVLSPLTNEPDEWVDRGDMGGEPTWQNLRCPAAFSADAGQTYYLVGKHDVPHGSVPIGQRPSGAFVYPTRNATGAP